MACSKEQKEAFLKSLTLLCREHGVTLTASDSGKNVRVEPWRWRRTEVFALYLYKDGGDAGELMPALTGGVEVGSGGFPVPEVSAEDYPEGLVYNPSAYAPEPEAPDHKLLAEPEEYIEGPPLRIVEPSFDDGVPVWMEPAHADIQLEAVAQAEYVRLGWLPTSLSENLRRNYERHHTYIRQALDPPEDLRKAGARLRWEGEAFFVGTDDNQSVYLRGKHERIEDDG